MRMAISNPKPRVAKLYSIQDFLFKITWPRSPAILLIKFVKVDISASTYCLLIGSVGRQYLPNVIV